MSRFIRRDDPRDDRVVFPLPATWWSRPYEYAWAATFVERDAVVLDVACGVCHPFKFLLGERAAEAYACDWDERILSPDAILADIAECVGDAALASFDRARLATVRMSACDMTQMPYADAMFDTLFCVSVLEHLPPAGQTASLKEFARVLKPDGLIVMTVDHPTVEIAHLETSMAEAGLRFAGSVDLSMPADAISSDMWGPELRCIRLLLEKLP